MKIDILTLFPEMCETVLSESIIGRARDAGFVEINCHNLRDFTEDKHNRVDDAPYGGGTGMIMQAQPIYDCYMSLTENGEIPYHLVYMSPQGKTLTQEKVRELSKMDNLALLCGHYEGVDERVIEEIVDEEISIGDYVLTGGELPAMVVADCVSRYVDENFRRWCCATVCAACFRVSLKTKMHILKRATLTGFSKIRNIRDLQFGVDVRFRRYFCRDTMPI